MRTDQDAAEIGKLGKLYIGLQTTLKQALAKIEEQSQELLARDEELKARKAEISELMAKLVKNENQLATLIATVKDYDTKGKSQTTDVDSLISRLKKSQAEMNAKFSSMEMLIDQLRQRVYELTQENRDLARRFAGGPRETDIRRELVGLQGPLGRVAILFDASESMTKGGRWESARKVVESWVKNLYMKECRLIVFNSFIKTFPADGSVINLQGPDGDTKRSELVAFLADTKPQFQTYTRLALQEAYKTEGLDTIILFTDGAPTAGTSGVPSSVEANEIYKLIGRNPGIPVNAVGIGAYYEPELAQFLLEVSRRSNGSFVGR